MQRRNTNQNKLAKALKYADFNKAVHKRRAFIICMSLAALFGILSVLFGSISGLRLPLVSMSFLIAALICDLTGVGVLVYQVSREKKNSIHRWAVEEAEKLQILQMRGDTAGELEKMLDYHLKTGNIEEADKLSHKLLAIVDADEIEQHDASLRASPGQASNDKTEGGLPDWLKSADLDKAEKDSKLPKWLQ